MKSFFGETKFDLRTLERALREGLIPRQEYQKYLEKLPDEKSNAEEIVVCEEEAQKKGRLTFSA